MLTNTTSRIVIYSIFKSTIIITTTCNTLNIFKMNTLGFRHLLDNLKSDFKSVNIIIIINAMYDTPTIDIKMEIVVLTRANLSTTDLLVGTGVVE